MTKGFKIALTAFVVTAGLIKGAPTLAAPAAAPLNVSYVHTADLDLSTDSGRRALERRLIVAARDVCGTASDVDIEGKNDVRQCRAETLAKAHSDRDAVLAANRGTVIVLTAAR